MLHQQDTDAPPFNTDDVSRNPRRIARRIRTALLLVAILAAAGCQGQPVSGPPASAAARPSLPLMAEPKAVPGGSGTGLLDIDSSPASYVLVDGRPLGKTPRMREPVSAGRHSVVFVYAPGASCRQSIDVSPGADAQAVDRLGDPSSPDPRCRGAVAAHP